MLEAYVFKTLHVDIYFHYVVEVECCMLHQQPFKKQKKYATLYLSLLISAVSAQAHQGKVIYTHVEFMNELLEHVHLNQGFCNL